jgi:hypothetical protein
MSRTIPTITENDLLQALAESYYVPPIAPDEVTAKMLAAQIGVGERQAINILRCEEQAGRLTVRDVRLPTGGKPVKAFRRA